jgi:ferredoxin-NADP reductase
VPHAGSRPNVLYDEPHLGAEARLPDEALALIQRTDTCYLATSYAPVPEDADGTAPRVGVNHRGGRPGFVRVRRDARTLVLPNYAGNRVLNSLGNIHVTPAASLVFPDFDRGAVLHVTGAARTLYDDDARRLMPESDVLTTITVTGFSFVTDALPLRHADAHYSAYSPPVRFLAEEAAEGAKPEPEATVTLVAADALTPTLTHYTFRAPHNLSDWRPAGTVVLDLRAAFGHLAGHDDCVRTWTVSHPPAPDTPDEFGLTLRTKAGGVLTPLLAAAVRRDVPMSGLEVRAALRGVKSSVPLPAPGRHLWIAGGIGATPFMALSRYIAATPGPWDIVLLLSTAEPTVLPQLFADALAGATDIKLVLHIFTHESFAPEELILPAFIDVQVHGGRIPKDGKVFAEVDATERHVHICGPLPFVNNAMAGLENAGVDLEKVYRERFTY